MLNTIQKFTPRDLGPKLKNEARAFLVAPIYPFLQPDWHWKMWIFGVLAYVPFINVTIARGWRMDYIHRLGWRYPAVLPAPKDALRFLTNGILLWIALGTFVAVPAVIIVVFGWQGALAVWNDLVQLVGLTTDYLWYGRITTAQFFSSLWLILVNEIIGTMLAFLVENIWLIIYIPIYRIGMIRFALTGRLLRSHLAVRKNLRFLLTNFLDIILMYTFNVFNFILIIVIDSVLAFTVIGAPLIPIVTF